MGAIEEFGNDVNSILADLDATFRALTDQKNALKTLGNDIAQRWQEYFLDQKKAMQAAQDALNRISNVPVSASPPAIPQNSGLSQIKTTIEK